MKRAMLMGVVVMLLTTVGCVRRYATPYGYRPGYNNGYSQRGHWVHEHGRDLWVEDRR